MTQLSNKAQKAISAGPIECFSYALNVLRRRFPEGESVIALDAMSACCYAKRVIGCRFIEGEAAIAANMFVGVEYANTNNIRMLELEQYVMSLTDEEKHHLAEITFSDDIDVVMFMSEWHHYDNEHGTNIAEELAVLERI